MVLSNRRRYSRVPKEYHVTLVSTKNFVYQESTKNQLPPRTTALSIQLSSQTLELIIIGISIGSCDGRFIGYGGEEGSRSVED